MNLLIYIEKIGDSIRKKKEDKKDDKKDENNDEDAEMSKIAGGKEAEIDHDLNILNKITEDELLQENLLSKFVPIVLSISKKSVTHVYNEDDGIDEYYFLYKTSLLTLCKLMCISSKFCRENLDFLFELLASSIPSSLKLNVIAAFGDLINRFPNVIQPKIDQFYLWYEIVL